MPQAVCLQEVFRQPQVRQRAALHPGVREAASPRRRAPALPSGPGRHLEPVFLQPAERPDVRAVSSERQLEPMTLRPGERRGVRVAWCQALASRTVWAWLSGQQVSWPGALRGQRAPVLALPSERALPQAQAVPQGPLKVAWPQQAEVSAG